MMWLRRHWYKVLAVALMAAVELPRGRWGWVLVVGLLASIAGLVERRLPPVELPWFLTCTVVSGALSLLALSLCVITRSPTRMDSIATLLGSAAIVLALKLKQA